MAMGLARGKDQTAHKLIAPTKLICVGRSYVNIMQISIFSRQVPNGYSVEKSTLFLLSQQNKRMLKLTF